MRKFLAILIFSILLLAFIPSLSQSKPATLLAQKSTVEIVSFDSQSLADQASISSIAKSSIPSNNNSNSNQDEETISGFLRDPIWQFIGAVLAVVTSIIFYFLQKSKKSLSYEILSETALLSVAKGIEDKIKILFEGDSVKNVHLILLKISNTGNVSILPSEFLKNITISFDNSTKILSAEISNKKPLSIEATLTIDGTQLIISPSLWNSGDTIIIKSLVSEFNEEIHVSGRIVGINDIKKLSNTKINIIDKIRIFLYYNQYFFLVSCMGFLITPKKDIFIILILISAIAGIIFWFLVVIVEQIYPRKNL